MLYPRNVSVSHLAKLLHNFPCIARTLLQDITGLPIKGGVEDVMTHAVFDAARITLPWSVHPERDTKWIEEIKLNIGAKDFAREFEYQIVTEEKEG